LPKFLLKLRLSGLKEEVEVAEGNNPREEHGARYPVEIGGGNAECKEECASPERCFKLELLKAYFLDIMKF